MPARRSARRLPLLFPSRRIDPFAAKRTRIHVSRFVTMPKIERRPLTDGAERWQWPAGMHRVLRQVLARRPLRGTRSEERRVGKAGRAGRSAERRMTDG